jgi:SAM-dependent methyltransferase
MAGRSVRDDLKTAGFSAELIQANVRKLRSLVSSFEWAHSGEGWSGYGSCDHVSRDRTAKSEFLKSAIERTHPRRVLDLGANDGHFSKMAAEAGADIIAVDSDEAVLDDLYRRSEGLSIAVVLTDLANPSPAQGWAGTERSSVADRAHPDLVIAYGLIHHLIYHASIPPREVVRWLRMFECPVVVEFVSPADEMVGKLIGNKLAHELHPNRDEVNFRALAEEIFDIVDETNLSSGTRALFSLQPR